MKQSLLTSLIAVVGVQVLAPTAFANIQDLSENDSLDKSEIYVGSCKMVNKNADDHNACCNNAGCTCNAGC